MNKKYEGFTLVELLIAVAILAIVVVGMIQIFIYSSEAADIARDKSRALSAAQDKMEEIRNHQFDSILVDYGLGGSPGNTFDLTQPLGKGVIYVREVNADLLSVKIAVCWQDKYGRIIGEDLNLNGILDEGEDLNANDEIDSIVNLISLMARR